MKPTVLVTDGEQRASLAIVRSLGAAGHRVYVAARRTPCLAGSSRWASDVAVTPDPLDDPVGHDETLARRVKAWGVDVLVPVTDAAWLSIQEGRTCGSGVVVPGPEPDAFRRVSDKVALLDRADAIGIATPERVLLTGPEPDEAEVEGLEFPAVVKPARSVHRTDSGRARKLSVRHVTDPGDLREALDRLPREAYPVMLQRRISGPGIGVFLLLWKDTCLARFAHRRIREKPPSGGVSVNRESIPLEPALFEKSLELLRHHDWQGVAMVEYKVDGATGVPVLMEVNGRFWGSLQLAIDAGVDFPRLLVEAATGGRPAPVMEYRTGIRSRWFWGEVDHLIARLRTRGTTAGGGPTQAKDGRLGAVAAFLAARPGRDRAEILRMSDPRPFLRETLDWWRGR